MSILEQEIILGKVSDETIVIAEQNLSSDEFVRYTAMVKGDQKSAIIAWLLWFFLGTIHLHMFYLGLFDTNHLKSLRIVALILAYFGVGLIIIIPLWIYDAIKMNSYIKEANNMKKAKILNIISNT